MSLFRIVLTLAFLILAIWAVCFGSYVKPQQAARALENQGFTNIHVVEHDWFAVAFRGCGVGDAAKFKVEATNPIGKPTQGLYVCAGFFFKGLTVRTE